MTLRSKPAEKHLAFPVSTTAPAPDASSSAFVSAVTISNVTAFILPSSMRSTVTSLFSPAVLAVTSCGAAAHSRR